jgi:hypothetical protein
MSRAITHALRCIACGLLAMAVAIPGFASENASDLSRLDGRYPWEGAAPGGPPLLRIEKIRRQYEVLVPASLRRVVKKRLAVGTPNKVVAGYLVSSTCEAHACPVRNFQTVVDLSNSTASFISFDGNLDEGSTRCFSTTLKRLTELPAEVVDEIAARRGGPVEWAAGVECGPNRHQGQ